MAVSPDTLLLLDQFVVAARTAGDLALAYFRHGKRTLATIESKAGGSPVTEADHLVDAYLRDNLLSLRPDIGWLSEETTDTQDRLQRAQVFVVDPIDGTRGFMSGDPRWAVCIGLVQDGRPVAGVVHLPALGDTFAAALGHGAFRNGRPIAVARKTALAGSRIAGPASVLRALQQQGLDILAQPRVPSLAYRLVQVADGSLDAGIASTNAFDWDIAAADIILSEAGGRLAGLDGLVPGYNHADPRHGILAASARQLHGDLTVALQRACAPSPG